MEEKKRKKDETLKDNSHKKASGQKAKVPESAPSSTSPGLPRHHLHPTSLATFSSSSPPSGDGKSALSSQSSQCQYQTPPLPQCQLSSVSGRYPPREVPPRFRQQEQKHLLKRGQPLPPGALGVLSIPPVYSTDCTNSATTSAAKRLTDISQNGVDTQHETSHWGTYLPVDSSFSPNNWKRVNIDASDKDSWLSIRGRSDPSSAECPWGSSCSDHNTSAGTTTECSSSQSMATGAAGQQAHYPSLKSNNNMMTGPVSASTLSGNRGWSSEGKSDVMNGGRMGMPNNWGSSNFNLNLNPNANPSAWPVLGHEGSGSNGPNGLPNSSSLTSGIKSNGNLGGPDVSGGGWAGMMTTKEMDHQHPSTNTCLSFNMEPVNLNSDGPNHTKQQQQTQEPMSPIHGMTGWGGQSPTESSQLNGDTTGSSVWGGGDSKAADSPKDSGWDSNPSGALSSWGRQGSGAGSNGGNTWGDWGKSSGGDAPKGWDSIDAASSGPGQEQPLSSWGQQPGEVLSQCRLDQSGMILSQKPKTALTVGGEILCLPVVLKVEAPPLGGPKIREWGEPEAKNNGNPSSMWEGENGNGGSSGWKDSPRAGNRGGGWGKQAPPVNNSWGDATRANGEVQGSWASSKPQESSSSSTGSGGGGSIGSWGGPSSVKQNNSNWSDANKADQGMEPTGWEEPSPPSIRRKMEIDDGTSTWGDPNVYDKTKTVNMWDRNNPTGTPGNNSGPPPNKSGGILPNNNNHTVSNGSHHHSHHMQHHPHHGPPPTHIQHHGNNNGSPNSGVSHPGAGPQRPPIANPGWGELPNVQPKSEPAWGEPAAPTSAVDNGTSAWGKPSGGVGGWGDGGHESYGRANVPPGPAPCKSGPKPMQDGWGNGGEEMSMSTSHWDSEDGDMWNSPTSQESNSSCNSWGRKGPNKGKMGNKPDEAWIITRLVKQLTDMGFPRDPAEEALKSNNMNLDQAMSALLEKKTDLDKRGMGLSDYSNSMNKSLLCRPSMLSKDSSDRTNFLDKDGVLSDDSPSSPFLPSPGLKLPMANSSLSGQGLGQGSPGLAMQNLNNRQITSGMFGSSGAAQSRAMQQQPPQPSVPPLSSSQPSLRAQVPQFLSPQVQAQLLQSAAKNIGLNPALLTSPINPQQMTLLYQLQQLQMAYQRLQIQQQMMQAQRNVSGPIRQQEQQVARTITNMQQQIQQHQRQLYQALLMKQQQLPTHSSNSSSAGLHPPGGPPGGPGKSSMDPFSGSHHSSGLADTLHTKEPPSSPNSYNTYPLTGLTPNMNVNCMEVGGLSLKEPPQPQSRLSQWTHSNAMDNLSGNISNMESNLNKHGAITAVSSLGPSRKAPQLEDSYSPYSLMSSTESPSSSLVTADSWGQGKSPNEKISNGNNINWPPEFCPGVPWKGLQNIDPENDPNMTPGSVSTGPTINTNIHDVNRYLLRDRNGGKLSDMKSTWSPGPISQSQGSLSHELWKVPPGPRSTIAPSRPPPGLTNTKTSTWGGNSLGLTQGWSNSYTSEGTTWSTDSSSRTSSWLVLRNLTPQIDGSTLRTLCMQHGPLITFHLNLTQGNAVVRYSSKDEAAKAQKSLHMCVLGNTTILAEFAGEEEVNRFFAQGQSLGSNTTSWQANQGTNQNRMGGATQSHTIDQWSSGGNGAVGSGGAKNGSGDLLWGGVPQYSSLWGPSSGDDTRVIGSPTPINTLLPGDLLSGESM
uniref:Trinucleotide repeat-containing gene 6C protein n=1 Tax=Knipowitschia caucasica TaxID=637954 RepID=A0AAV2LHK5_KNICA